MLSILNRTLRAKATRDEVPRLQSQLGRDTTILGESAGLVALRDQLAALAPLDVDVILTGETGTGKELSARALHNASPRAAGPYVALNCAALPEALFETEVFGHAAAAFVGTLEKPGKLEAANGGTLMLDEVEAMPLAVQAKFLRALQERHVERLGENHLRPLDLRVVTTSKADLRHCIAEGRFRADLFYRLAGAELRLPPCTGWGWGWACRKTCPRAKPCPTVWPSMRRERLRQRSTATASRWRVAQSLGIPRRTLADKMARYGIKA